MNDVHELSIAMSIVEMAHEEATRRGGVTIEAVHLRIGSLSGVVKDALRASFGIASEDTLAAGAHLVIEDVPVTVRCPACDATRPIRSLQEFCCAECGTPTADVVGGRELLVTALELRS